MAHIDSATAFRSAAALVFALERHGIAAVVGTSGHGMAVVFLIGAPVNIWAGIGPDYRWREDGKWRSAPANRPDVAARMIAGHPQEPAAPPPWPLPRHATPSPAYLAA